MRAITGAAAKPNPFMAHRVLMAGFLAVAAYLLLIVPAFAAASDGLCTVLGDIIGEVEGNVGRGLATIGILALGCSATVGKISWGMAVTVAIGIAVIFGAATLAVEMTPSGNLCYTAP